MSFDTRCEILTEEIKDHWEDRVRQLWLENKTAVREGIKQEYGDFDIDRKISDFIAVGREPFSVIAFHNVFLRQCRTAFVAGSYYPALVGICALGERILNHMILRLRDYHKASPYYKRVYRKQSFDDWNLAISAVEDWNAFVTIAFLRQTGVETEDYGSDVADCFRSLCTLRNEPIHFRLGLEFQAREPALKAIHLLREIVTKQFGVDGPQPWFISGARAAYYIKKHLETLPFVREFYLPSCVYVGPNHTATLARNGKWYIDDPGSYDEREITDEEFAALVNRT